MKVRKMGQDWCRGGERIHDLNGHEAHLDNWKHQRHGQTQWPNVSAHDRTGHHRLITIYKNLGERRFEAILDAAENVFTRSGYNGASMRETTSKADVSQALIYHLFKSKALLFKGMVALRFALINGERVDQLDTLFEKNGRHWRISSRRCSCRQSKPVEPWATMQGLMRVF